MAALSSAPQDRVPVAAHEAVLDAPPVARRDRHRVEVGAQPMGDASPRPAMRDDRSPLPQPVTVALSSSWTPRPRSPRYRLTVSAISRSAPVGEAMPARRTNRSTQLAL